MNEVYVRSTPRPMYIGQKNKGIELFNTNILSVNCPCKCHQHQMLNLNTIICRFLHKKLGQYRVRVLQ